MNKPIESTIASGENIDKPQTSETISIFWLPVFVLPWLILYFLIILNDHTLPTPLLIENEVQNPYRFIAERAQRLNAELTEIGPRVVGSIENEMLAIQFLEREIEKIIESRNPIHNITYDIQRSSGSFQLDTMTSLYQDIQNVIVKITPADRVPAHCLLLNSHFDSVPISPGAADAGTMSVVMMEVLRVVAQNPNTFEHGIIFLFNGAEEVGLQGAHMFITQHPWAADIRAVMNLDAGGSGGGEVMFRSTPNNHWLIKYYKNYAIHPKATVLFDELFDLNLIPSDTDFRIFRDYGNISGMDFSTYRNGYVYHTQSDSTDKVPMATYQNVGDNVLSIAKAIANAEELGDPNAYNIENPIFFDYLGWFMVSYTITESIIINVVVFVLCLAGIVLSIWSHIKNADLSGSMVSIQFGLIIIIQCVSIILAAGILLLLAVIYDACHRSMSYFSNPWILFGIYYCPLMFCLGLGCALHITFWKKKEIHVRLYVQMYLHAQTIFLVIIILAMTILGIRSAFAVLISLIFYTLTMFINFFTKLQLKDVYWTLIHFVGHIFPFVFFSYYAQISLEVFVPILGRSGPDTNPESIISIISICFGILMTGYLMPTFSLFKRPLIVLSGFLVVFICFIIVIATPIGFPFRAVDSPQRFWIFDTQRTFHNLDGSIRKTDNGYFMLTMDRHMNEYVVDLVPELDLAQSTAEECINEMFCGMFTAQFTQVCDYSIPSALSMPLYTSRMIAQSKNSFWVPHASPLNPNWPINTTLRLLTNLEISSNVHRLTFEISGPDHMSLLVSPKQGNIISDWNLLDFVPNTASKWGDRWSYFVFLGHGGTNRTREFFIDLEVNNSIDGVVDVTVVGHYNHYENIETDEFRSFRHGFPDFAQITSWMCTLQSWVY